MGIFDTRGFGEYDSSAMSRSLTAWYDPGVLGRQNATLDGEIELESLQRLSELVDSRDGSVKARFRFDQGRSQCVTVDIDYEVTLELLCQRCLEPFTLALAEHSALALIEPEGVEDYAPQGYEPLSLEEPRLQPIALLEDELIMALPLVPRHAEDEECGVLAERVTQLNNG